MSRLHSSYLKYSSTPGSAWSISIIRGRSPGQHCLHTLPPCLSEGGSAAPHPRKKCQLSLPPHLQPLLFPSTGKHLCLVSSALSLPSYLTLMWLNKPVCVRSVPSVVSDSLRPHGLEPARLLCPWDFPRREYWSGLPFPFLGESSRPRG